MPNALTNRATRARHLLSDVLEYWFWRWRYFLSKVNIWNVNSAAPARAFVFNSFDIQNIRFNCLKQLKSYDYVFQRNIDMTCVFKFYIHMNNVKQYWEFPSMKTNPWHFADYGCPRWIRSVWVIIQMHLPWWHNRETHQSDICATYAQT